MKREELEKKRKEAEDFLNTVLLPKREEVANGIQQVIGRIQTYNDLLNELGSEEVADTDDEPADSDA